MKISLKMGLTLALALLLMCIDFTYEWRDPIESEGQAVEWYSSFGLADGRLALSNHDFGVDAKFIVGFHKPVFFPLPLYVFGGPEGGGVGVAVWFVVAVTAAVFFIGSHHYKRLYHESPVA